MQDVAYCLAAMFILLVVEILSVLNFDSFQIRQASHEIVSVMFFFTEILFKRHN